MDLKDLKKTVKYDQRELDLEVSEVIKDLNTFLKKNLKKILDEAVKGDEVPAIALSQLLTEFKNKGLKKQIGNIAEIYGSELARIKNYFIESELMDADKFDAIIDMDTVEALIKFRVEDIQNRSVAVIGSLRPKIMESVLLGAKVALPELSEDITQAMLNYTKTELNTALISFSRTVNLVQAESVGIDNYLYIGPYDKITRPFCRKVLSMKSPPIYSMAEIKTMDNDQGLPVAVYGGGYNCRHRWRPVSTRTAKQIAPDLIREIEGKEF